MTKLRTTDTESGFETSVPARHKGPSEYAEPTLAEFLAGQYRIEPKVDQTRANGASHAFDVELPVPRDITKKNIELDASIDPFAPRDGKTLTWQNVNMKLVSSHV
jgi:hypothetical protein